MKSEKEKNYQQSEFECLPKKRGGWRNGGRPKSTGQTTNAVRIDKRLESLVNALKDGFKNGTLSIGDIEKIEFTIKQNETTSTNEAEILNQIIESVNRIEKCCEIAEDLESKRKGEDYGQFAKILEIGGECLQIKRLSVNLN